jgi:antitoxin VapB
MALSIKNREFEEAARELAQVTGKSITEAGLIGIKRELARQKDLRALKNNSTWKRVQEIQKEYAALSTREPQLSDDEILGYDEFGIPSK